MLVESDEVIAGHIKTDLIGEGDIADSERVVEPRCENWPINRDAILVLLQSAPMQRLDWLAACLVCSDERAVGVVDSVVSVEAHVSTLLRLLRLLKQVQTISDCPVVLHVPRRVNL